MGTLLLVLIVVSVLMVWLCFILKIAYTSEKSRVLSPTKEEVEYNSLR